MSKRSKPTEQRTRARRPETRSKAERAWSMRLRGKSLAQIGAVLEMGASGVHELLSGYVGETPIAGIEDFRTLLLARLDLLQSEMWRTLRNANTTKGQCDAARTINGIVRSAAIISGAVKQAPPVVVVNRFAEGPDLSRLPIERIEQLTEITKLLEAPAIEAHGEAVEDGERATHQTHGNDFEHPSREPITSE